MSDDRLLRENLAALADDAPTPANPVGVVVMGVRRRKRRRAQVAAGAAVSVVIVGGGALAALVHAASDRNSPERQTAASSISAHQSKLATTSSTSAGGAPSASPIPVGQLEHRGILVSAADEEPSITAADAIRRARAGFASEQGQAPAAELYRITVTDLGTPDPDQPYGYDLLVDDRLAWVITFPKRRVYGSHDAWSDESSSGIARTVVFIDAQTGKLLLAETF